MNDPALVTTPEVTIIYPEVFEPVAFGNSEPKYSATFLIDSDVDIKSLRAAVKSAAYAKWPNQESDFYTKLQLPLRNGNSKAVDENGKPDEETANLCHSTLLELGYGALDYNTHTKYVEIENLHDEQVMLHKLFNITLIA